MREQSILLTVGKVNLEYLVFQKTLPRSIGVKLLSFRHKEELIKTAWQKKRLNVSEEDCVSGLGLYAGVLKKQKEYTDAKKVLTEKKIHFQTPFPVKLCVFNEGETCAYKTVEEAI